MEACRVRSWPLSEIASAYGRRARGSSGLHGLDGVTTYATYGVRSLSVRASLPADEVLIAVGRDVTLKWTTKAENDDAGM